MVLWLTQYQPGSFFFMFMYFLIFILCFFSVKKIVFYPVIFNRNEDHFIIFVFTSKLFIHETSGLAKRQSFLHLLITLKL